LHLPVNITLGEFLKGSTPLDWFEPGADLEMLKGGVLIVCRAVGSNFVVALALLKAVYRAT